MQLKYHHRQQPLLSHQASPPTQRYKQVLFYGKRCFDNTTLVSKCHVTQPRINLTELFAIFVYGHGCNVVYTMPVPVMTSFNVHQRHIVISIPHNQITSSARNMNMTRCNSESKKTRGFICTFFVYEPFLYWSCRVNIWCLSPTTAYKPAYTFCSWLHVAR